MFDIELKGGIGELDYGGVMLKTLDILTEKAAKDVVVPEVKKRIDHISHETERSIYVERKGFFNPKGTVQPLWAVVTKIIHNVMLELGHGGRNAYMRPAGRSRATKTGIRDLVKKYVDPTLTAQVRNFKKKKK